VAAGGTIRGGELTWIRVRHRPTQRRRHLTKCTRVCLRTDNCWSLGGWSSWIRHVIFRRVPPVSRRLSLYYACSSRTGLTLSSLRRVWSSLSTIRTLVHYSTWATVRRPDNWLWFMAWDATDTNLAVQPEKVGVWDTVYLTHRPTQVCTGCRYTPRAEKFFWA